MTENVYGGTNHGFHTLEVLILKLTYWLEEYLAAPLVVFE